MEATENNMADWKDYENVLHIGTLSNTVMDVEGTSMCCAMGKLRNKFLLNVKNEALPVINGNIIIITLDDSGKLVAKPKSDYGIDAYICTSTDRNVFFAIFKDELPIETQQNLMLALNTAVETSLIPSDELVETRDKYKKIIKNRVYAALNYLYKEVLQGG